MGERGVTILPGQVRRAALLAIHAGRIYNLGAHRTAHVTPGSDQAALPANVISLEPVMNSWDCIHAWHMPAKALSEAQKWWHTPGRAEIKFAVRFVHGL